MQRSPGDIRSNIDDDSLSNKTGRGSAPKAAPTSSGGGIHILAAVIHLQDLHKATRALEKLGISVIRFSTSGAFLGRRNVTLIITVPESQEEAALNAIKTTCRQRVEYISSPLEGSPMPMPLSTPVHVGGATVFSLPVERFEEI